MSCLIMYLWCVVFYWWGECIGSLVRRGEVLIIGDVLAHWLGYVMALRLGPGMGIRSSVFRGICSFFVSERVICSWKKIKSLLSLLCHERPEGIAHFRSFVKSNGSKLLKWLYKKEWMSKERREGMKRGKTVKNIWKIWMFSSDLLVFASDALESLTSFFFKERRERYTHATLFCFLKKDVSESLMVAFWNERFWAKEQRANERKSEWAKERMSERAKERILNPG